ncbi:MAG: ABC transporter ATP-binding protein [Verrucomicrobiaceae bacterium]|nr:MAG: ABC transporter ATP-binding protein [Verrucomicrobiaceae bacterium]
MVKGFQGRDFLRLVSSSSSPSLARTTSEQAQVAIEIRDATLNYPLGAFARASLKTSLLGLLGHRAKEHKTTFVSALRGVNLDFKLGERVALIGHNGSGKSTLLRSLAGIYPLDGGSITVVGRIGTLLDVGLGFEPEATGRENIYHRGLTMGYSRSQLKQVEERIIDFAELGEFIDLPVRIYSAGMFVRLGFAISTEFSPEILLVDEVFGAGDAAFAKRALDRMMAIVARAGILVIATHDLPLIEKVCKRVIWLERGQVVRDGAPLDVLPEYVRVMAGQGSV